MNTYLTSNCYLVALLSISIVVSPLNSVAWGDDELNYATLGTESRKGMRPELHVREMIEQGHRRLALMVTFRTNNEGYLLYNPFGVWKGRAYTVVLTNANLTRVLHTVVQRSAEIPDPPELSEMHSMHSGALVGRCHWTPSRRGDDGRPQHDLADLPKLPAGNYAMLILVTRRQFGMSRHDRLVRPEMWTDAKLDAVDCVSRPVFVKVDEHGEYHLDAETGTPRFEMLEAEPALDDHPARVSTSEPDLMVTVRFTAPSDDWLLVPAFNLFALPKKSERSASVSVTRKDGAWFQESKRFWGGSYAISEMSDRFSIFVPRDGIVGGTLMRAADSLAPGEYEVTAEINESIYTNVLFKDGMKQKGDWTPIAKSPKSAITVKPPQPQLHPADSEAK